MFGSPRERSYLSLPSTPTSSRAPILRASRRLLRDLLKPCEAIDQLLFSQVRCSRDPPWYEFSMKSVAKVAVSLPLDTLKSLERVRLRLRKTRSGAVTEAIERWLQSEEVGDDERRYLEGYLRHPERAEDGATLAGAVVATWEPWE
jgi:hypothetical protein